MNYIILIISCLLILIILIGNVEFYTPTSVLNSPGRGPNIIVRQRPQLNLNLIDRESNEQYYLPLKKDRERANLYEQCLQKYHSCLDPQYV